MHDGKRPLQIYCAGLVFAPRTGIIRKQFESDIPAWICQIPRVNVKWGAELQTLEGHSDLVLSVAISPDGRLLVSGSYDKTVRLWETATGRLQQTLEGHTDGVMSLASGSYDKIVRLWDTATGRLQQTLEGHTDVVVSVAF
jgi:WD40 repeat protein